MINCFFKSWRFCFLHQTLSCPAAPWSAPNHVLFRLSKWYSSLTISFSISINTSIENFLFPWEYLIGMSWFLSPSTESFHQTIFCFRTRKNTNSFCSKYLQKFRNVVSFSLESEDKVKVKLEKENNLKWNRLVLPHFSDNSYFSMLVSPRREETSYRLKYICCSLSFSDITIWGMWNKFKHVFSLLTMKQIFLHKKVFNLFIYFWSENIQYVANCSFEK